MTELREKVARIIAEDAICEWSWEPDAPDSAYAEAVAEQTPHYAKAADAILATLRNALLSDEVVEAARKVLIRRRWERGADIVAGKIDPVTADQALLDDARQALTAALQKIGAPNVER